jgi:hypothetical protein
MEMGQNHEDVAALMARIRERARLRRQQGASFSSALESPSVPERSRFGVPDPAAEVSEFTLDALRHQITACEVLQNAVGELNPRPPGLVNDLLQRMKKLIGRALSWYTRPLVELHAHLIAALQENLAVLEALQNDIAVLKQHLPTDGSQPQATDRKQTSGEQGV